MGWQEGEGEDVVDGGMRRKRESVGGGSGEVAQRSGSGGDGGLRRRRWRQLEDGCTQR